MEKPTFDPNKPFEVAQFVNKPKSQTSNESKPAFDPNKPFEESEQNSGDQDKSFLDRAGDVALDGLITVGRAIDTYTGAPIRAGIGAAQSGKNPITAATKQIGENPDLAPTGKQIAQRAGVPDTALSDVAPWAFSESGDGMALKKGGALDITASGAAGLGLDIAADPTNIIPGVAVAKGVSAAGRLASKAAPQVGRIASATGNAIGKGAGIAAEALTGVPLQQINTYAKNTDKINDIIKRYGDDSAAMSDDIKQGINNSIIETKTGLNKTIEESLNAMPENKIIDISWLNNDIAAAKSKLRPGIDDGALSELDELTETLTKFSADGKVNASDLFRLKNFMQGQAKSSYAKAGQIFVRTKDSARAANGMAAKLRKQVNQIAPEIAQANNSLHRLHKLEETMNKNLIAVGKSDNALLSAGSGVNSRGAKQLKELGSITGKDILGQAESAAAAKTFARPPVLPMDTTGKSLARTAVAYALGGFPAAAMTSPVTLKIAINAGQVPKRIMKVFGGGVKPTGPTSAQKMFERMSSDSGRKLIKKLSDAARVASIHSSNPITLDDSGEPDATMVAEHVDNLKGRDKWAYDGLEKLAQQDSNDLLDKPKTIEKLYTSKKGKELLIRASDLSPKSEAFKKVQNEISTLLAEEK
jgi:hypothetical protein